MSINPYETPSTDAAVADNFEPPETPTRPLGITILALLHGFGSLALAALFVFGLYASRNEEWFAQRGLTFASFLILGTIAFALGLASGVGMWIGANWGWWLATWYWFFMAIGSGVTLPISLVRLRSLGIEFAVVAVVKNVLGLCFQVLLVVYFFRRNVLRFFGLESFGKLKALGILIAVSLFIFIWISSIVAYQVIKQRREMRESRTSQREAILNLPRFD
jgi:hypothetical protein